MTPVRAIAVAITLAAAQAGCGGSAGAPDAGPAADAFTPPACKLTFGHSYVLNQMKIPPPGQGVDITGDGVPDNELGFVAALANPTIARGIATGTGLYVLDLLDWGGPAAKNDSKVLVRFYAVTDADQPPDPSNDLGGHGRFLVIDSQLDVNCHPLAYDDHAHIDGGVLTSSAPEWPFFVPGVGTADYLDLHLSMSFDSGPPYQGTLGAAWSACAMSLTKGPLFGDQSMLDVIVNQFGVQPDIDIDGDGLEQFVADDSGITSCIDGDGTTIPGPGCACDPRMADGYSITVSFSAVDATLVGIFRSP